MDYNDQKQQNPIAQAIGLTIMFIVLAVIFALGVKVIRWALWG